MNIITKIINLIKKIFIPVKPDILGSELSVEKINNKIKSYLGVNKDFIVISHYKNYFDFLEKIGFQNDFQILIDDDKLVLSGTWIKPLIINENNQKLIIFCHGVTNNRWSLFYCLHLMLQLGYQVVSYDARGHGISEKFKSMSTIGKEETEDLEDIINWVKNNCNPKAIGIYGFSMGANTCLFWLNKFQYQHPEVKIVICESPCDEFSEQLKHLVGEELEPNSWKHLLFSYFLQQSSISSLQDLEKINPIYNLPYLLSPKLLLLHGTNDNVISWRASWNIYRRLCRNIINREKVNAYFFLEAEHGDVPIIGDALTGKLRWIKRRKAKSAFPTFTSLLTKFLQKNF